MGQTNNDQRLLTSWKELHDEVEVHLVLEAVEHFDDPQTVRLHQDVPLGADVSHLHTETGSNPATRQANHRASVNPPDLLLLQHVGFPEYFHGVDVTRVLLLHQTDLQQA